MHLDIADFCSDLASIDCIILPRKLFLLLLLAHLQLQCLVCFRLVLGLPITLFLDVSVFLRLLLCDYLQHDFFISLGLLTEVSLRLVVAEGLVLGVVALLVLFHLDKVLLVLLIILLELPLLIRNKPFIVLLDLPPLRLQVALLVCKSHSVVPLLID